MSFADTHQPDPERDLLLERVVDVPPETVWAAWTMPEHLVKWFVPPPWTIVGCDVDLRIGGAFRTIMRSPDGDEFPMAGCYLEITPPERLVWTSVMGPGFRPQAGGNELPFTAVITMEPAGAGTRYSALAIHGDTEKCREHSEMGFLDGWGTALDQLVAIADEI